MLVLKRKSIVKGMINVVSGEGGGFCIAQVVMDALGIDRPDLTAKEARYYDQVCVDQAQHPFRSTDIFMNGSPCGWHRPNESPSACASRILLDDEL
jgi:hypothetical protein